MTQPATFSYDVTTSIGVVRLLTNDKYEDTPIFYDEELTVFLLLEAQDVRKAAAKSLETIAADEVLVQKVIKLMSLSTDGSKTAAELRANAAALRAQADNDNGGDGLFDIAEWVVNDFAYRQMIVNNWLRTR